MGIEKLPLQARIAGIPITDPIILHVHHKHYVYGNLLWDYGFDVLITVCRTCHYKIHESEKIPVYTNGTLAEEENLTPCDKCSGTGIITEFHYCHGGFFLSVMGLNLKNY